jgi:hypothetical protein
MSIVNITITIHKSVLIKSLSEAFYFLTGKMRGRTMFAQYLLQLWQFKSGNSPQNTTGSISNSETLPVFITSN